ncbi:MAG: hypothetical protein WC802_04590 [Patescibacteria group bacterium]|jgi:hypothetical protein
MQHVLDTGKRALSAAVAAATIAFSIGAGVLVNPGTTQAASAGDLIRSASLSTVYYYGYDGMRYTFPNVSTYKSWYMTASGAPDFSHVMTVSDSTISDITLGGNVEMRPGTYWVKVTSDPKVYAVARNGMMHWIESEAVAVGYAGSDWNQRITDVPDVFFTDYTVGTSLMTSTAYNGMLYSKAGNTYLAWDGAKRLVSTAGFSANGFNTMFVMDGSGVDDAALTAGTDLTIKELSVVDGAQTESGSGVTTGGLTVSAASSMPAGASLPGGANAVEAFRFTVKAGTEAATFNGVTLSMIGAGSTNNISNTYLYEGSTRLTESRTVNSSTRQVSFNNLNKAIAAGATHTYTVRITTSTSQVAADTIGFKITAAADVVSGGAVSGSFPITGNIFTFTGSDAGTLLITKTGTISSPTIGQQDAKIGEFKIAANGSESASVTSVTLKIDNAADHADYRLWDGTVLVAQGVNTSGDAVLFDLSAHPFAIAEGGNNIFSVTADVGGQANDEVHVFIDNDVDVIAIGGDFGFGLSVDTGTSGTYDGTTCTSASGKCSWSTVKGGKLTFAFNGPSAGDIQTDSQDQVLLKFSMTASQFVTIKDMDIIVGADDDADGDATDTGDDSSDDTAGLINTGAEGNLKDIKIINSDTGAVVMGPMELDCVTLVCGADGTNDARQTIDFTDDWSANAGETINLAVTADIDNGIASATAVAAIFDISGLTTEDSNGDALATSDIVPGSDMTGYNQVARAATLAFALASTPSSVTTVDGTQNVSVIGFTATAGDASDVTVTDFTLNAYGDDAANASMTSGGETASDINDYVESCSLYDGTTLLAGPEAPSTNGQTVRFDTIRWTLAHGSVKQLTAKCNFANTSTSGSAYFAFDIEDASTDVVAEDSSGDTFTVTGSDLNGDLTAGATATAATRFVTLADSGTLAVAVGADTPSADFVLDGSNNNQVATYRFTATNEAFNVQTLTFSEEQAEDDTNGVGVTTNTNESTYANNISLVTITYPKADGTTGTATTGMSGNEAKFSSLLMYVPTGTPKDVKVYVNVPGTDRDSGGSATSNERIRMGLFVDTTNDDNYKIVGAGSGATLDDDDQAAVGNDPFSTDGVATFVVKETKPTITLSASSPSGSAVVGRSEVLRFNVAASANEDVVLQELIFKLSTTDNAPIATASWNACDTDQDLGEMRTSDFDLYNLTTDGTSTTLDTADADWTLMKASGAVCDTTEASVGFARITLPSVEIVPKGVSQTFALYIDTTGASSSSDDSIRVDLPTDPINSTYLVVNDAGMATASLAATATSFDVDGGLGASYTVGDILVLDVDDNSLFSSGDEAMLVTLVATDTISVVRGYLNTLHAIAANVSVNDAILRMPSSLVWKDDGVTGVTGSVDDFWGSYLVDNLTVNGGTLVF